MKESGRFGPEGWAWSWGGIPLLLVCLAATVSACRPSSQEELIVSAAISLTNGFQDIAGTFEELHPGVTVELNVAASGSLATQIAQGAPADVFASAGQRPMDFLERQGHLVPNTRIDFVINRLVLVVPRHSENSVSDFSDLGGPGVRWVTLGNPETVPAGFYARETLLSLSLWQPLQHKMVLAENVRQALAYVERGDADAGLVYRTDAAVSEELRIVTEAPLNSHPPIRYPIAVIKSTPREELARTFVEIVTGRRGQRILRKYGFAPAADPTGTEGN